MKVLFKSFFVCALAFLLLSKKTLGWNVLFRLPIKNMRKVAKVTKHSKGRKKLFALAIKKPRQLEKAMTKTLDNAVDAKSAMPLMSKSKFSQRVDKSFDEADVSKDGHACFAEVHELALKLRACVNRQAPVPPPMRSCCLFVAATFSIKRLCCAAQKAF